MQHDEFMQTAKVLLENEWRFAKTMPQSPHWYTLRKKWSDGEQFEKCVMFIREHGYTRHYGRSKYYYLNINGMKYWTMGAPLKDTILINRASIDTPSQYDAIAGGYDNLFTNDEDIDEDNNLLAMLPSFDNRRVLDVGCGTGWLLDHCKVDNYTGVDPSSGMLDVLEGKHPGINVVHSKFEGYYDGEFDVIVSLFASASYIDPQSLARIPLMLADGGEYFVMFYKDGYHPETYKRADVNFKHFNNGWRQLGGDVIEFGNFVIVRGSK